MPLLRWTMAGLFTFLAASGAPAQAPDSTPVRVFTAGHSFHLPMVNPLVEITQAAGANHKLVGRQMIGGSSVTQHWERKPESNFAKKALEAGEVDVLTLSPNTLIPDPAIDKFTDLLLAKNPRGRVLVQISWIPYDGNVGPNSRWTNAQRDDTDLTKLRQLAEPYVARLREQVKTLNATHAAQAKRDVAFTVPSAEALYRLRERIKKGEVPGITTQASLFQDDLGHGGPTLAVLNSYCHYAVIYGKNPVGQPVPDALKAAKLGDNTAKVNRILQECAWEAVQAEPLSGVKAAAPR